MPSVTYKNQPAIDKTKGNVPLEGTRYLYTVKRVLWPKEISEVLQKLLLSPSLHVCCGHSPLGDVRADFDPETKPDVLADAAALPFPDESFASVLCDPPYNGSFQWNHDLLCELSRVASQRIIFQHWFIPADPDGLWKKWHKFEMTDLYAWQPRTYFGRVQLVSVFDAKKDGYGEPEKASSGKKFNLKSLRDARKIQEEELAQSFPKIQPTSESQL